MTEEVLGLVQQIKSMHIYQNRYDYHDYCDMGVAELEIEDFVSLVSKLSDRYFWSIIRENRALALGQYTLMTHELAMLLSILGHERRWISSITVNLDCLVSLIETAKMTSYYSRGRLVNPS